VFDCANTEPARVMSGVNTLALAATPAAVPDVVALAAAGAGGIVDLVGGTGSFSVATVNVGAAGTVVAFAHTGVTSLPISLAICRTNPATGACVTPAGPTTTVTMGAGETSTFAVFAGSGGAPIPFDPATNRIFVWFVDGAGALRGATSVAVRTGG
jgi:hypothetical protein